MSALKEPGFSFNSNVIDSPEFHPPVFKELICKLTNEEKSELKKVIHIYERSLKEHARYLSDNSKQMVSTKADPYYLYKSYFELTLFLFSITSCFYSTKHLRRETLLSLAHIILYSFAQYDSVIFKKCPFETSVDTAYNRNAFYLSSPIHQYFFSKEPNYYTLYYFSIKNPLTDVNPSDQDLTQFMEPAELDQTLMFTAYIKNTVLTFMDDIDQLTGNKFWLTKNTA